MLLHAFEDSAFPVYRFLSVQRSESTANPRPPGLATDLTERLSSVQIVFHGRFPRRRTFFNRDPRPAEASLSKQMVSHL
jgi:hypothetical protein